jgi:methionyl-tRNA formyltransferase
MQRIVPFVDHEVGYRLLHKLVEYSDTGRFEIPAVVTTQENGKAWWPGVYEICLKANIPLFFYEEQLSTSHFLQKADWFLLLSWKHIMPADLINLPNRAVINLHYSILPSYRGVYPVNWAIINGEEKTGFTYHFVNERIDDGRVFMQVDVPVRLSDTARTLQSRIDDEVFQHFDRFLDRLLTSDFHDYPLESKMVKKPKAEYYSRERFERACRIDLKKNYLGKDFFNILRGLTFFDDSENAYIIDGDSGKRIYVSIKIREEE